MSGTYTVPLAPAAATAQQDLFEVVAHASKPAILLGVKLHNLTEVGDAAEEMLSILIKSGQTTSGSGGAAATPVANDPVGAPAAGFTAETGNTTKASAGTIVTHKTLGWNVRMEMDKIFPEGEQIIIAAGRRLTVELATTPADSITIGGELILQEVG